ncbi:hypothetical protein B0H66DRAFT_540459 [Apodospora peruviana]|uniref:Uncharacterized protein n=1 Tax=Apodospora peruviana TaxID=516989 RepID=A0AAE0ME93_9PEZI|nr:hypothetical protein B0H66DRAFT_540459 [Apodospora peruviana]
MSEQRVAIVTGAASGIGKALATRLVEKNWRVALLDINEEAGTELASTLGPSTIFLRTDVSSYQSQSLAFSTVFFTFGRIDALCANAGIVDRSSLYLLSHKPTSTVTDIPPSPDLTATDIDLKGVIYGVYLATHFMRFNPTSSSSTGFQKKIIATSSIAGSVPHPALPEYSAAKAGVVGFVRAVAPVLRQKEKIAFSAVCPGLAATAVLPGFVCDAVGENLLTPVDAVVKAYEMYLEEETDKYAGEVSEVVGTSVDVVPPPKVKTDLARLMMVAGMEPIFGALHSNGEASGVDVKGFF